MRDGAVYMQIDRCVSVVEGCGERAVWSTLTLSAQGGAARVLAQIKAPGDAGIPGR